MLNMLIAIMGDTFERVIENRELNSTKTRLELLGDLSANIRNIDKYRGHKKQNQNKRFLFLVTPDDDERDENASWEGSIRQMSKITAKRISKLENNLVKHISSLSDQADRSSKRDISQDSALKKLVNQMIRSVMDKQAELKVTMETKVEGCNKKIESLGQKTNEIDAKMNRLLNLLGAEEDEQRPTQRTQTGLE